MTDQKPKGAPLDDWKRFALLVFGLAALIIVIVVYMVIRDDIGRML